MDNGSVKWSVRVVKFFFVLIVVCETFFIFCSFYLLEDKEFEDVGLELCRLGFLNVFSLFIFYYYSYFCSIILFCNLREIFYFKSLKYWKIVVIVVLLLS